MSFGQRNLARALRDCYPARCKSRVEVMAVTPFRHDSSDRFFRRRVEEVHTLGVHGQRSFSPRWARTVGSTATMVCRPTRRSSKVRRPASPPAPPPRRSRARADGCRFGELQVSGRMPMGHVAARILAQPRPDLRRNVDAEGVALGMGAPSTSCTRTQRNSSPASRGSRRRSGRPARCRARAARRPLDQPVLHHHHAIPSVIAST